MASSTLASRSTTGCPPATPSCAPGPVPLTIARPTTTWTALGRPSISRLPAPNPVASMRMAGSGPHVDTVAASRAAPVGVVSSSATSTPWVGAPSSRPTTAGAGLGSSPWAARTMPVPLATELDRTSSMPKTSSAAAVPTTSTMASRPPTSWKCTCSGARRWRRPSTSASARNVASARRVTRSGRRASSTRPAMCPAVRTTPVSEAWTTAWVAAIPQRRTGSKCRSQPATGRRSRRARTSSGSAPASTSDPSAMSPAIPEKQWNQATVLPCSSCDRSCDDSRCSTSRSVTCSVAGTECSWSWGSSPVTAGSAARRRRRRSRCRCRPRSRRRRTRRASPAGR